VFAFSCPGLPAKPIIDMCAVHRDEANLGPLVDTLRGNGWELRGGNGISRPPSAASRARLPADFGVAQVTGGATD